MVRFLFRSLAALVCVAVAVIAAAELTAAWIVRLPQPGYHAGLVVGPGGEIFWAGAQRNDSLLQRRAADGQVVWSRSLGKSRDGDVYGLTATPDGAGVIVGGHCCGAYATDSRPWIAYHDAATGARLWSATLDAAKGTWVNYLAFAPDGRSVYLVGTHVPPSSARQIVVARVSAAGELLWLRIHDQLDNAEPGAIAVDPKGKGVFVGGTTYDRYDSDYAESVLLRYSADGELVWSSIGGRPIGDDDIVGLVVSANGKKLFAFGTAGDSTDALAAGQDWRFQQYKAATGKAGKARLLDPGQSGLESARAMTMARNGKTFFLAGDSCDTTLVCEAVLLQVNSRGAILGRAGHAASDGSDPIPRAVSLDADGMPVWAGDASSYGQVWIRKEVVR